MKLKNRRSKKWKLFLAITISIALFLSSTTTAFAGFWTAYITYFDLVDSGKHLDYNYNTKYSSHIPKAVGLWGGYKSGIIRKDSSSTNEDIYITDCYYKTDDNGITSMEIGIIELNTYQLDQQLSSQRTRVVTHEIGHALGLADSNSSNIMCPGIIERSDLGLNDKASYDAAYNLY